MKKEFEVGDVVQLKSGSPQMSVIQVDRTTGCCRCIYWEENNNYFAEYTVPMAALTEVEDD